MEKFTNSSTEFFLKLEEELILKFDDEIWEPTIVYSEIGQLRTHAFSITILKEIKTSNFVLKLKNWNSEFDNDRFKLGIFNLDRLAISEKQFELKKKIVNQINEIVQNGIKVKRSDGIILDGLTCKLIDFKRGIKLNWQSPSEMNLELEKLVNLLIKRAGI